MKIGILGGTFNPPHMGHLVLAQEVLDKLKLDKIFFIPTNIPPHKENEGIETKHRLAMVSLSMEANDSFELIDVEIKRGGISYTIDTLRQLIQQFPHDEFYLIVGSDLANDFSSWKEQQELKKLAKIVVACRDKYPLKKQDDFIVLDIIQINISSSQIRGLVKKGHSIRYLVPEAVASYIEEHHLYRQ
ncbi:MAG: nicotinate-nucleotide adenylyltransferase [Candidatus Omnitrophota bacterium]|nr:MAG: nicotinate-nucleotide adenylyltransferase [Candidatus Omnitrophota bacterium]